MQSNSSPIAALTRCQLFRGRQKRAMLRCLIILITVVMIVCSEANLSHHTCTDLMEKFPAAQPQEQDTSRSQQDALVSAYSQVSGSHIP